MKDQVRLDGLLFSRDAHVIDVMSPILNSFAIEAEVCPDLVSALNTVRHRRLDAIVVDWSGEDPTRIVRDTRKSSPNSDSTILAGD